MCIWTSCLHQKKLGYGWGILFAKPLTFRWWQTQMYCEDRCYIDVKIEELYCSLRTDRKLQRQTNYWHNITSSSFCRSWCNAIKVTYFIWVQCTYSCHAEVVAILTGNYVSLLYWPWVTKIHCVLLHVHGWSWWNRNYNVDDPNKDSVL